MLRVTAENREQRHRDYHEFFATSMSGVPGFSQKRYVFVPDDDPNRISAFIDKLIAQGIEVQRATQEFSSARAYDYFGWGPGSKQFPAGSYIVSLSQPLSRLANAILDLKEKVGNCSICNNITDEDPCALCQDPKRDHQVICVVEEPKDLMAIERSGGYRGLYHVLGGVLSPLEGIGESDLIGWCISLVAYIDRVEMIGMINNINLTPVHRKNFSSLELLNKKRVL